MLDFTTPYKVLVNKKSWDKHNSKNKVNDVLIEKLPEKQKEALSSDRKASKLVKISFIFGRILKIILNLKVVLNHNYDNDFQVWSLKWKFLKP